MSSAVTQRKAQQKTGQLHQKQAAKDDKDFEVWGRASAISRGTELGSLAIMLFCPLLVIMSWAAIHVHGGALSTPLLSMADGLLMGSWRDAILTHFPAFSWTGVQLYAGWLVFQAVLYMVVPGSVGYGQMTPAGYKLPYIVNGTAVWILTHAAFVVGAFYFKWFSGAIIYEHWGGLLIAANLYGYALTLFAYAKAHVAPSHPEDCKFSGSVVYDMFMGIEFNPRIGKWFDFKLFHNGRPGIIAWTLINLSMAAAQYQRWGLVTNSMVLINILHAIYVLDFFYNEDWYLRTIDIAHDHFGFYLSWGDSVWLPFMYTLQAQYLVGNPYQMSWGFFAFVAGMGLSGYAIFRGVNHQKDIVRRHDGKCNIWGKPATFIRANYTTGDGKEHTSILITSGFWGLARHFNYLGDLLISTSFCLCCGFAHILPYFYIIYMTLLLVIRVERDQARCLTKYGRFWQHYCSQVPYKIVPYIY